MAGRRRWQRPTVGKPWKEERIARVRDGAGTRLLLPGPRPRSVTLGKSRPSTAPRPPLRGLRDPRAASRRPRAQGRGALQAESPAVPRRPRGALPSEPPPQGTAPGSRRERASPRRPPRGHAARWASYPGVHRPHGSLSDRRLTERPGSSPGSRVTAEGASAAAELLGRAPPTSSGT